VFERFTERARQVIVCAQESAREQGSDVIDRGHILAGLTREEEGLAARVLASFDVTPDVVQKALVESHGQNEPKGSGQIPFTDQAKKSLELALREALSLGHNYIGTEHILLALTRVTDDDDVALKVLVDHAEKPGKVRDEVIRVLSGTQQRRPHVSSYVQKMNEIVQYIAEGLLDDHLKTLRSAIDERNQHRQSQVIQTVKEVFGDDFIVTRHRPNQPQPFESTGPSALPEDDDEAGIESRSPIIGPPPQPEGETE
jgi:ATP-dependent Clp protease ATP-binding subunit ClpA